MRKNAIWWSLVGLLALVSVQCATQEQSNEEEDDSLTGPPEPSEDDNDDDSLTGPTDRQRAGSDGKHHTGTDEKQKAEGTENGSDDSEISTDNLPFFANGPVAAVDGSEISARSYNEVVAEDHGNSSGKLRERIAERMKTTTLDQVIETYLVDRELQKADIEVSDEQVEEEFEASTEKFPNDEALASFLKARNLTKKEFKRQIRRDLKVRKLLRERDDIEVTDEEAKTYYDNNPDEFEQKEKVKARHILIEVDADADDQKVAEARKKAKKLAEKARKQETDFATLAKKHSDGPSAKKGGDLGFFTEQKMVDPFSKEAFSMENGEISDPVRTNFGFHVIKRENYREGGKQSFDEAKPRIVDKLERKRFGRAHKKFVSKLKREADIEKMPDNIEINESMTKEGPSSVGGLKGKGKNIKLKKPATRETDESGGSEQNDSGNAND